MPGSRQQLDNQNELKAETPVEKVHDKGINIVN
jgi:hypothetical protein